MTACLQCGAPLAQPETPCGSCEPRPATRRALPMPAPAPAQPPGAVAPAWVGSQPGPPVAAPVASGWSTPPSPAAPAAQGWPPPAYAVAHPQTPFAVPIPQQAGFAPLTPPAATVWPGGPSLPALRSFDPSARGWGGLQQGWWAAIGGGALLLVLIGVLSGSSDHTVTGAQEVVDDSAYELADGTSCDTQGGYSDVGESAMVTLTDARGVIVGRASLQEGYVDGDRCVFPFTISGVPDSSSYGVQVGDRNTVVFTKEAMEATDWSPVVVLGE